MKCQIYADNIHVAPSSLHNLASPWPFSMWGLDIIGPIEPKAFTGHRFILVAIDYFTNWVEAASYSSVTKSIVVKFIKRDIICRYGLSAHIITSNGTNLNNKMVIELSEQFKIKHHNSTPYHPKMNGAVEVAKKNIKKIVKKMVATYKDWHDMLPYVLHGYRTSIRTSTRATPYSLVYGTEAVLLVEVEIPSLRVLAEIDRLDQLNLVKEKRLTTLCHGKLYQKRIKSAFDKKLRPSFIQRGGLSAKKGATQRQRSKRKVDPKLRRSLGGQTHLLWRGSNSSLGCDKKKDLKKEESTSYCLNSEKFEHMPYDCGDHPKKRSSKPFKTNKKGQDNLGT
ncbi:gag-pol, partial [Mucuna pruriens]